MHAILNSWWTILILGGGASGALFYVVPALCARQGMTRDDAGQLSTMLLTSTMAAWILSSLDAVKLTLAEVPSLFSFVLPSGLAGYTLVRLLIKARRALHSNSLHLNHFEAASALAVAIYVLVVVGGATLARLAGVGFWSGVEQVAWEAVDGVPFLKLTEGWDQPIVPGHANSVEAALFCIRLIGLVILAPVVFRLVRRLRTRQTAAGQAGEATTAGLVDVVGS